MKRLCRTLCSVPGSHERHGEEALQRWLLRVRSRVPLRLGAVCLRLSKVVLLLFFVTEMLVDSLGADAS